MKDPKKVAAVMAAVKAYIQTEEEALVFQSMPVPAKPPAEPFSPWRFSGRQDQMQMRLQMLMKAYHR
ncbi:MAG: hypothetical protein JRI76_03215 [Deltaproteobacteria bacterium]|nr:hypothetical protein [Deltaproteobacteria bacterium]MBW1954131.1 hypothetical protein [Deltaproteobacteria bacterium]MBW2041021.1 hypothetical protein [Deltaproteobacteria bacterium]MBW2131326.1 hypothetical protein [Deltaproteobacteria bacterium]